MSSCGPNNQADDFHFDVSDFTNKNQQSFPPQISGEGIQIVVDHVDMEQQRKDSCKFVFVRFFFSRFFGGISYRYIGPNHLLY